MKLFEKIKLNLSVKNILILIVAFGLLLLIKGKYQEKKELEKQYDLLLKERTLIDKNIETKLTDTENLKQKSAEEWKQIDFLTNKIDSLTISNESEFKKKIYLLGKRSGLIVNDVSKNNVIWSDRGYELNYIFFYMSGNMKNVEKFLYLINKNNSYIDTSKMLIEYNQEGFKISLGFITKN